MKSILNKRRAVSWAAPLAVVLMASAAIAQSPQRGAVQCANLIYGRDQTSRCFSSEFLSQLEAVTYVTTEPKFVAVKLDSPQLYNHPFAVMTGEGRFSLTPAQRQSMRNYLFNGGFIVASAGCSSQPWVESFRREIAMVLPEVELRPLDLSHPVFHTVYDIRKIDCKKSTAAHLEGLEVDGKIVLIFSPDGLNDTAKAGGKCCCCGGNEIRNSRQINVNLLGYALTH